MITPTRYYVFQVEENDDGRTEKFYTAGDKDGRVERKLSPPDTTNLERLASELAYYARVTNRGEFQISFVPPYDFAKNLTIGMSKIDFIQTEQLSGELQEHFLRTFNDAYDKISDEEVNSHLARVRHNFI